MVFRDPRDSRASREIQDRLDSVPRRDRRVLKDSEETRDSQEAMDSKARKVSVVPLEGRVTTVRMDPPGRRVIVVPQEQMDNKDPQVTVSLEPMEQRARKVPGVLRDYPASLDFKAPSEIQVSKVSVVMTDLEAGTATLDLQAYQVARDLPDSRGLPVTMVAVSPEIQDRRETEGRMASPEAVD